MRQLNVVLGNVIYWACYMFALMFLAGALWVVLEELGESPAIASGFALALALLIFGFGWSSRCMLLGRS